jgi:hypothetical protein
MHINSCPSKQGDRKHAPDVLRRGGLIVVMCRPGCVGWFPEYGKAWEHWGMPAYVF